MKLSGFKSFVEPTTIKFPSNLMGIVGPNGCGKSNIIDAIRWVLGESSAKTLRGEARVKTLCKLGELCERHDLLLLCDEVWEGMIYGEHRHVSALAVPSLRERTIKVGSAGKIFSLTGWKVGWAIAARPLAEALAQQHQYLNFTIAAPLQWAVTEGLALPGEWHAAHRARYEAARERLVRGLSGAGYSVPPAHGTWFVTMDLAASHLAAGDEAIADRMVREAGVAAIPVSAAMFGQRELPFRSVLEHTAHGARLRSLDIEWDGPGWALVSGEARVTPVGQGARQTARIDYRFEITVRLKLPKAERWGQRALTRMIEFTAKTVLSQVAEKLPGAVARAAGVAAVVA